MISENFRNKKNWEKIIRKKFKNEKRENDFLHYEEPKGIFNYIKNIGNKPVIIETEIQSQMKLYELTNGSKISIEYVG